MSNGEYHQNLVRLGWFTEMESFLDVEPPPIGTEFSISMWFRLVNARPESQAILEIQGLGQIIFNLFRSNTSGKLAFSVRNGQMGNAGIILRVQFSPDIPDIIIGPGAPLYHLMMSFDVTTPGRGSCWLDGVDFSDTIEDWDTPDTIPWGTVDVAAIGWGGDRIPTIHDGSVAVGDYADLWFDNKYIDLTQQGNREKFRAANGDPVDLGDNGELPVGEPPTTFFGGKYRAKDWRTGVNLGTASSYMFGSESVTDVNEPAPIDPPTPIPPPIPPPPPSHAGRDDTRDLFTRKISPVLDRTRGIVDGLGLRVRRVFLVHDQYEGPDRREGVLIQRLITEILPSPTIQAAPLNYVVRMGGSTQEGDFLLDHITRDFTQEELLGKDLNGGDFSDEWDFYYAIYQKGQRLADFYNVVGEPLLLPTRWQVVIRPTNRREQLVVDPE